MGLFSFFQGGAKYFDKKIEPKCDYCMYGKRTKDGNRVLCEKRGLVEQNYSCKAFIYSPLKRIPVKQLRFVGSIADDELFIESKGDIAEKQESEKKTEKKSDSKSDNKKDTKPAVKPEPAENETANEAEKQENNEAAPTAQPAPQTPNEQKAPVQEANEQKAPVQPAPAAPVNIQKPNFPVQNGIGAPANVQKPNVPVQNAPVAEKPVQQNEAPRA
ncbi:hypothetical protein [Ruminococcus sp.]|uniref:hypothetical protein n=1 Tax=Ruminococcus sp. TaxID=41978 RepID=UPI0025D11947|nr:hypothetical protein [Ruminococcus sp.]